MITLNKQEIYSYLQAHNISYIATEHPAVFTVEEVDALHLPHPESGAKNLFLRDDKKRNYYLLVAREHLSIRLKDFQRKIQSRSLSFASEDDLMKLMGLIRGAVTPLGVLNDEEHRVAVYIDAHYRDRLISVHHNDNTATVCLQEKYLMELIKAHGNPVEFICLDDPEA